MTEAIVDRGTDAKADRVVAYLLDFALLSIAAFGLWVASFVISSVLTLGAFSGLSAGGSSEIATGSFLASALIGVVVNTALWILIGALLVWYFVYYADDGQTFGKRSQGVAVVDEDGSVPAKRQRLIRTAVLIAPFPLMALFGALLGAFGFVIALFLMFVWLVVETLVLFVSDGGQRLGDRAAGTYVVDADA